MTHYYVRDTDDDEVIVIANTEDGTVEIEESLLADTSAGEQVFSSLFPADARKLALRLLQAAEEVDPS